MTNYDIITAAIDKYGEDQQIIVAIEELSELQKELTKHLRGEGNPKHIAEEMADVRIILSELGFIFNNFEKVTEWEGVKLNRLWQRVHPCEGGACPIIYDPQ